MYFCKNGIVVRSRSKKNKREREWYTLIRRDIEKFRSRYNLIEYKTLDMEKDIRN